MRGCKRLSRLISVVVMSVLGVSDVLQQSVEAFTAVPTLRSSPRTNPNTVSGSKNDDCGLSTRRRNDNLPFTFLRTTSLERHRERRWSLGLASTTPNESPDAFASDDSLVADLSLTTDLETSESRASMNNPDTTASVRTTRRGNGGGNNRDVGGYDPSEGIEVNTEKLNVGNPQLKLQEKEFSVTSILKELAAIQQQGPQKYCILGTRHCSYLHQQIIELLAYALVLSGNHVYTSGASGTNAATIRGALRAERPDLLTVVVPQSMAKQTQESQQLLKQVEDVIEMPQNNDMSLDIASRICNSYLLSLTDQLISFAFHESTTVIEATKEAKKLDMLVTVLFLD